LTDWHAVAVYNIKISLDDAQHSMACLQPTSSNLFRYAADYAGVEGYIDSS